MDMKYKGLPETDNRIVYIRPVAVAELSQELQDQVGDATTVYSVHRQNGEQLALVADRALAFVLARQHDLAPMSVH